MTRCAAVVAAGLLAGTLAACSGDSGPEPTPAAKKFLDTWAGGDVGAAAKQTDDPATAQGVLAQAKEALAPTKAVLTPTGSASQSDGGRKASQRFTASWTLPGVAAPWRYDGKVELTRSSSDGPWKVHWQPGDFFPKLGAGQKLEVTRTLPDRAALLDRTGDPLFEKTEVVTVGLKPSAVTDLQGVAHTLASTLKINADDIVKDVQKAKPDEFVPVITLRQADYQKVRSAIHDLPGTVFSTGTRVLGPSAQFGQPFLGKVGEATADAIKNSGGAYVAGDQIGLSGLQEALNATLTGKAGVTITVTNGASESGTPSGTPTDAAADSGSGSGSGSGDDSQVIGTIAPTPGTQVKTTLDRRVQQAADAAVATVQKNAAIVALKPSTGEILAVANGPNATFDMAMSAQVPAGSTFKMITATAALSSGVVKPDAVVNCPGTVTVAGRTFHNENSFDLGNVPVSEAFAHSCNTTFINLGLKVDPSVFANTAASFGIGAGWDLPVTSYSGSVSPPKDDAARAADSIGQGTVLVSPLAMALVAATAQHGSTPTPSLIEGTKAAPKKAPSPPPAAALANLRTFMRAVVTGGTAKDLGSLPGDVSGKTGTAEYGTDTPPRSHAWFAGYQGDLAFAVFVEDGQSSSTTAVPVAKTFLSALG